MRCLDAFIAQKGVGHSPTGEGQGQSEGSILGRGEGARFLAGLPPALVDPLPRAGRARLRVQLPTSADDSALAAAMAYVDLNPIRAGMADSLEKSDHTSVQQRVTELRANPEIADAPLQPIAGFSVFRFPMSASQYIDLVDWTGRQVHPGKRGKIAESEPPALRRLGLDPNHWTDQAQGIGCGYWRVVGSAEALIDKAAELGIKFLRGIGYARKLAAGR